MIDIKKLTVGELEQIAKLARSLLCEPATYTDLVSAPQDSTPPVGTAVLIRTVTHYYTGRIKAITLNDVVLEDAAWIADTGRFATALVSGEFSEVEPYPDGVDVIVRLAAVIDISIWSCPLPREQK